jgi:predicted GIY-YIG superfamily endonuclease
MSLKFGKINKNIQFEQPINSDDSIHIGTISKSRKVIKDNNIQSTILDNSMKPIMVNEYIDDLTDNLFDDKLNTSISKIHYCYILRNRNPPDVNRTYNGYTVDPGKRIRQHNQEIKGGAIYTKTWGNKSWEFCAILKGFPDHHNALQCEWRIKHPARKRVRPNRYNSPEGRIVGLNEILKLEQWTSKSSINVSELNLELWILKEYAHVLTDVPPNIKVIVVDEIDPKII